MIREYQKSDWPAVKELYGKSFKELYFKLGIDYPDLLLRDIFTPLRPDDITLGIVSEGDENIQGYIIGTRLSDRVIKLNDIFFEPGIRGTAEPTLGFRQFERLARDRGFTGIVSGTLVGHEKMEALLKIIGFKSYEIIHFKELT